MKDKVQSGRTILRYLLLMAALIAVFGKTSFAQEIEPRTYSRAPIGTQTVIFTYGYQSGDVFTDAALPLSDVGVSLNSFSIGYARTLGLAGRQMNVGVFIPYVYGKINGNVLEERREVTRSGLGDIRLRITQMLTGSPALKPKEFASFKRKTLIGATLSVIAPTGQYDPRRLVNIGSNRWAFKPEIGISKPLEKWTFELAAGAWMFTPNNNFFGGRRRAQKPLLSLQAHVTYTIRSRMWIAVGGTYFNGGRTSVNGVLNSDLQNNVRFGGTFSYPFGKNHSLKISALRGVTTRIGSNLTTVAAGWQYTWF